MGILNKLKSNPRLKHLAHKAIVRNAKPRSWIKFFVTPFIHHFGTGSVIRRYTRLDIFPFNKFSLINSTVEDFCTINNGIGDVLIGECCRIGIGSVLIGPVTIGKQVILAQNIVISGLNHTYTNINIPIRLQKVTTALIIIEDEV